MATRTLRRVAWPKGNSKNASQNIPISVNSGFLKFPLSPGLVVAACLFFLYAHHAVAQTESPLIAPRIDSHFDSDISQPLRFRDDLFNAPLSQLPSARYQFEILPAPIRQAQNDEVLLPNPTPTPLASPVPTPIPTSTPIPTPSVTPVPSPTASVQPTVPPTPSIPPLPTATPPVPPTPTPVPIPSIPPRRTPQAASTPAFPVPAPNDAPRVAIAPPRVPASQSSAPSLSYLQQLTPVVEVWRSTAPVPEIPTRRGSYLSPVGIAAEEAIIVRLQFGTGAIGKNVILNASPGVAISPQQQVLVLPATADFALLVSLGPSVSRGAISFYCEGLMTTLPLGRLSPTALQQTPIVRAGLVQ
ncbi:MAG: hypothetical protein V7609_1145 [Verrucomicrobiota bacterium]